MRALLKLLVVTAVIAPVWSSTPAYAQRQQDQPRLIISGEALAPLSQVGERVFPGTAQPPASNARVADGPFWAVASLSLGMMLTDTATTYSLMHRCPQCRENDPYTAPIIGAGPKVAYPVTIAFGTGVMTMSWWMKHEHSRLAWWVLPVAIAAGNAVCIASNSRY